MLLSRFTLVVLLLSTLGLTFAVYDRYQVEREMAERRRTAEIELLRESQRQEALQDRVNYLENDQGLEAEIRRHFDVALEGEQVIVIVDEKEDDSNISAMTTGLKEEDESESFWDRWLPW